MQTSNAENARFIIPFTFFCFIILLIPGRALAGETVFGRVSDLHGSLHVKGGFEKNWVEMGLNVPLGTGDSLWLEHGGLAEMELPGGTRIRMEGETKLDFASLRPERGSYSASLEVLSGRLYFRTLPASSSGVEDPVEVRVSAGLIYIQPDSLVRVDLNGPRITVRVMEGWVRIDPSGPFESRPLYMERNEGVLLSPDSPSASPKHFSPASEDGLDRYNRFRDERFLNDRPPDALDSPLVGQGDLERHGLWVRIDGDRYWRPYVPTRWRPYSVGYWAWYGGYGWTWISNEPFGYVTFHYGRWHYDSYYGWVWSPGYIYAPAHVYWITVGPYYAWAPLGLHGHPVTTGPVHISLYWGIGIDLNVWSYARHDYFIGIRQHRHHSIRHAPFKSVERRFFREHPAGSVEAVHIGSKSPGAAERRFDKIEKPLVKGGKAHSLTRPSRSVARQVVPENRLSRTIRTPVGGVLNGKGHSAIRQKQNGRTGPSVQAPSKIKGLKANRQMFHKAPARLAKSIMPDKRTPVMKSAPPPKSGRRAYQKISPSGIPGNKSSIRSGKKWGPARQVPLPSALHNSPNNRHQNRH